MKLTQLLTMLEVEVEKAWRDLSIRTRIILQSSSRLDIGINQISPYIIFYHVLHNSMILIDNALNNSGGSVEDFAAYSSSRIKSLPYRPSSRIFGVMFEARREGNG